MLAYDWMWWGQLTNQNLARRCVEVHGGMQRCTEVCRGTRRCAEGCAEVHRGVHRGMRRCAEMCGGMQRCTEGCMEVRGGMCGGAWRCAEGVRRGARRFFKEVVGKNQDFMLIRFLNAGI